MYDSVRRKILSLPEDYVLYPAHDYHGLCNSRFADSKNKNKNKNKTKNIYIFILSADSLLFGTRVIHA